MYLLRKKITLSAVTAFFTMILLFSTVLTTTAHARYTQDQLQELFDIEAQRILTTPYDYQYLREIPYLNSPHFAGLTTMFEITNDTKYLDWELEVIEDSLGKMYDIDGDGKLEWEAKQSPMDHDTNPNTPARYSCLYTQRGVREMMRIARIIKNDTCLGAEYQKRADAIIAAVKKDIINDPYCKESFLPTYTWVNHIVSHPLTILLELYYIEGNVLYLDGESYKTLDTVTAMATSMKSTHFPQENGSVLWGNMGCKVLRTEYPACYYLDIDPKRFPICGDNQGTSHCYPIDVSHADNYISTINQLYRSSIVMTKSDIDAVTNTFLLNIWNHDLVDPKFKDFTDGNLAPDDMPAPYLPWVQGRNISPGWISLGAWSQELQTVAESIDLAKVPRSSQFYKLAYFSQLAKNMKVTECKISNQAKEISDGIDNDCDGFIDENQRCSIHSTPGDFDGDNKNDISDLSSLVAQFETTNCQYNLVGDCLVDIFDYNKIYQLIELK